MKNKPDTSHYDNLVLKIKGLLEEDKSESEIFEAFKHEGMPKETILHAICSADPNSPILDAYTSRVIIPNVNSIFNHSSLCFLVLLGFLSPESYSESGFLFGFLSIKPKYTYAQFVRFRG